MSQTSTATKSDQVNKYETFINNVLRRDLAKVHKQYEELCKELSEYLQVRAVVKHIQQNCVKDNETVPLKSQTDIGCNFYVQCVAPDPRKIILHVGMGFYVEVTLEEALSFIEKKEAAINQQLKQLTSQACKIKAHIKLVLDTLAELQNLNEN